MASGQDKGVAAFQNCCSALLVFRTAAALSGIYNIQNRNND